MSLKNMLKFVPVLLLVVYSSLSTESKPRNCREPGNKARLIKILRRQRGMYQTCFGLAGFNFDLVPASYISIGILRIPPNHVCSVNSNATMPVCPSMPVLNYDPNRFPRDIASRVCSTSQCTNDPNSIRVCKPVFYYLRVLRRIGCRKRIFRYEIIWEPISIDCHCVQPGII